MSNKTENGILTSVKLSEEHFGEMVTSESAEGIDTLIYIEVYVNNDSVISWQSPEINIGIDIQLGNNSDGNNKLYSVSYHELDKILTDKFVIQFNEQTNRYLNHGKLHLLQVGRSSTSSFSLINTEKGWQSLTNDYLDGLVRFENVIRDRKRLDFNKKIIHRSYKYIGDEVEVVTHELIED